MIFANGTSGTIGRFLPNSIVPLSRTLENQNQEHELARLITGNWSLIHLAGVVGAGLVDSDLKYSHEINVEAASSLGNFALKNGVSKFVYISSSHVYAKSELPIDENSAVGPSSNYAIQKLEAENRLINVFEKEPEKLCIVRVFSILDWGMPEFTLGGAIERVIADPSSQVLKESLSQRDFLAPYQIAKAIYDLIAIPQATGIINLCTGVGTTVRDAALRMAELLKVKLTEKNFELTESTNSKIVGDNSKLLNLSPHLKLVWSPSAPI